MSDDLVTFNIRCGKSLSEVQIKTPINVSEFMETLKCELNLGDLDEIVILCPTSEGKMMEIKSDDDIEFLKKTKLCFNAVTKEIYCSVELVLVLIPKENLDDEKVQIKILASKIEQLGSKFEDLSLSLNCKIAENTANILESFKLIMSDRPQPDSNSSLKKNSFGEQSSPNICTSETKPGLRLKKTKKDKEKLQSSNALNEENIPNTSENLIQPPIVETKDMDTDTLLKMLVDEGFTNTIQNIIVLKRFENDFEKALNHLKSSAS